MTKEELREKRNLAIENLNYAIAILGSDKLYIDELEKQLEETKLQNAICEEGLKKQITELEAQNKSYEELIENSSITLVKERLKNYKQFIKAKELLLELYDCIPSSMADSCKETLQKVALFFKDSEVEK